MNLSVTPNEHITFGVAYEDEHVAVVEKPARRATQPGKGHQSDTLLNGLFAKWGQSLQNLGAKRDFGLLHRLDKDTSGLLIVALKPSAYDDLRQQFEKREIRKFYWAICARAPQPLAGVIRLPIAETPGGETNVKTAHVSRMGKPAVTAYRTLDVSEHAALIDARPVTGRLHQVRVHLDAIGCPLLGDPFYGPKRTTAASPRLALHAHAIAFRHPATGQDVRVDTDWPHDLRRTLRFVGLKRPDLKEAALNDADTPE